MKYYTRTSEIETSKGQWSCLKVEILQDLEDGSKPKLIGSYNRNYHGLYKTFFPFQKGDKWYALYSKDYEETRVMELPSCDDLGGESSEFCPVEYYVPSYEDMASKEDNDDWNDQYKEVAGTFGFVSGCYWGDDNSWKICYLDLTDLRNIKIEFKFGYIKQPNNLTLKECIDLEDYAPSSKYNQTSINIAHYDTFNLKNEYIVGYPIEVTGKGLENTRSNLLLHHDVNLEELEKKDLIKIILKQEEYMDMQRSRTFHLHNLKNELRNKFGDKITDVLIKESNPQK